MQDELCETAAVKCKHSSYHGEGRCVDLGPTVMTVTAVTAVTAVASHR